MYSPLCWPLFCTIFVTQEIVFSKSCDENIKWLNQSKIYKNKHYEYEFWFVKRFGCG